MFFDYAMVFNDEAHANSILNPILQKLRPWQYSKYTMGTPVHYEFDEANPWAEPVVTVLHEGWHVDVRLRAENKSLNAYLSNISPPLHVFG